MASILDKIFQPRYTISELLAIDQGRQERAANCKVSLLNTFFSIKEESLMDKVLSFLNKSPRRQVFYITFKFQVKSDTGNIHNVYIQVDPDFDLKRGGANNVRVYCRCPDFKYRSAYILGQRDSLFLNGRTKSDLGDAWKTAGRGKAGHTFLCKHAYASLKWLLSNYINIMNTI
jgi:hypothetical protein